MNLRKAGRASIVYLVLLFVSIVFIFPFVWIVLTSFKSATEATSLPPQILPSNWLWSNYKDLFHILPFGMFYLNTVLLVFFRILCALLFSSMAGYAFAKIPFRGRNFLFSLVILQFMIPAVIFIYPQYRMLQQLGMLNTVFALVFPGLVSAFGTFLMRQAFMVLPDTLEEAATLDGCNRLQTFCLVYVPLLKSFMVALSIFTLVFGWKDVMWPLIVNSDANKMTLSAGIMYLQSGFGYFANYGIAMAGASVVVLPLVVLYFIFQNTFQKGIAMSGIK